MKRLLSSIGTGLFILLMCAVVTFLCIGLWSVAHAAFRAYPDGTTVVVLVSLGLAFVGACAEYFGKANTPPNKGGSESKP